MPVIETLVGYNLQAIKGSEVEEGKDETTMVDVWMLVLSNMVSQDQIRISFRREVRDALVSQLTGGIVLAGGELPRL